MRPAAAGPREGMTAASGTAAPEDFRTLRQRTEQPDPSSPAPAIPAAPIIGSRPPASRTPDGAASGGRATNPVLDPGARSHGHRQPRGEGRTDEASSPAPAHPFRK